MEFTLDYRATEYNINQTIRFIASQMKTTAYAGDNFYVSCSGEMKRYESRLAQLGFIIETAYTNASTITFRTECRSEN